MRAWRVGSILTDFSARSFGVNFSARASFRLEMRIKTNFRLSVECLVAAELDRERYRVFKISYSTARPASVLEAGQPDSDITKLSGAYSTEIDKQIS